MRRSLSLVFLLSLGLMLTAQDQSKVDSLEADLASRPLGDTARLWTLHYLCRAAQWVDLPLAKKICPAERYRSHGPQLSCRHGQWLSVTGQFF